MKVIKNKKFEVGVLTSEDIDSAERFCMQQSSKLTEEDMSKGKLASLRPQRDEDGVIILSSRADEGQEQLRERSISYPHISRSSLIYLDENCA